MESADISVDGSAGDEACLVIVNDVVYGFLHPGVDCFRDEFVGRIEESDGAVVFRTVGVSFFVEQDRGSLSEGRFQHSG